MCIPTLDLRGAAFIGGISVRVGPRDPRRSPDVTAGPNRSSKDWLEPRGLFPNVIRALPNFPHSHRTYPQILSDSQRSPLKLHSDWEYATTVAGWTRVGGRARGGVGWWVDGNGRVSGREGG